MKRQFRFALVLLLLVMEGAVSCISPNKWDKRPPEELYIALQMAQEWWELRSQGFSDFVWSKPSPNWRFLKQEVASSTITYSSPSSEHETLWFAEHRKGDRYNWGIQMPTLNNWKIEFSIILSENREEKGQIIEVRFIYSFSDLHGIYLGGEGEKKPVTP